jgi:hypothetical protein
METTYQPPLPLGQRINFRMVFFAAVVLFLVGTPVYIYLDSAISGGIKHHGDLIEVDLKAMSVYPFDQIHGTINDVPQKWRDIDGKRIMVYGEQWVPQNASENVNGFQLCYSIAKCCFSGPPQVQHFVDCTVKSSDGQLPIYNGVVVKIVGTLHVHVIKSPEKVQSVYQMDVESVEPTG